MANGYVRQSAAEIQTGNVIEAASLNDEYDAIVAFASAITGHNHDGTTGGGAPIPTAGLSGLTNTSSGIMVANGTNAFLSRTLTGTANEITITNGTGVSGNPTFSLPSALTFTGKTITGGTFTSTALTSPSLSSPTLTDTPIIDIIRTSGTSGVVIQNSGGTTVLTVGPSNTTASTFAGTLNINGSESVTSVSNTQTLTNKTINLSSNTLTGTTAQFNTALSDGDFATLAGTETLTNKTINLSSNTLTGTTAQFNTALSDGDFATLAGTETLTNKTINLSSNTLTGTRAQFNTALSDADFAMQAFSSATAASTSIEFTSIPSYVRHIVVSLAGVSTNGADEIILQLGDSGGYETSGYVGCIATLAYSTSFRSSYANAANIVHGTFALTLVDSITNTWVCATNMAQSNAATSVTGAGSKALSATLDRIRLTTTGGTNTFDAGNVSIVYY